MKIKTLKISKNFAANIWLRCPVLTSSRRDIWINLNRIRQKEINSIEFKFWLKKIETFRKLLAGICSQVTAHYLLVCVSDVMLRPNPVFFACRKVWLDNDINREAERTNNIIENR